MVERQNPSVKNPVFRRILFGILTIAVLLALLTIGVWAEVSGGTVSDGVYALKNKATGKFLDIQYDSPNAGMHIQQYAYDITPSTPDTRSGLFKFTHRGGNNYLIRSMRNNANSFYRQSDTAVLTTPIETVDIDNPMKAHWILSDAGNGYVYIRAYQTDKYLCAPTSGVNNGKYCTTETLASGGDRAKWKMVRYTGSAMYGVELSSWTDTMVSGETTRIAAYMYTTDMAYHGPVRYSVSAPNGSNTDLATVDADGNVTVNGVGQFRIRMTYAGAPKSWYENVTAKLADGVFFVRNCQSEKCMQIDNYASTSSSGAIYELLGFDGGDDQRWNIAYVSDGYYKITSVASGLAATAPSSAGNSITQTAYTGSDKQLWRITSSEDCMYKLSPKSSTSYYMAVGGGITASGGQRVVVSSLQTDSKDEWYLCRINGTEAMLMGISAAGHNHETALGNIMPDILKLGYKNFNFIATNTISRSRVKDCMADAKIYVSRSHGSSDAKGSYILLANDGTSWIHSSNIYNFTSREPLVDLSDCDLMLFVACKTGANESTSLPHAAVAAGAKYAIGFKKSIGCDTANQWLEHFFDYYSRGYSVELSAYYAARDCSNSNDIDSYIIVSR